MLRRDRPPVPEAASSAVCSGGMEKDAGPARRVESPSAIRLEPPADQDPVASVKGLSLAIVYQKPPRFRMRPYCLLTKGVSVSPSALKSGDGRISRWANLCLFSEGRPVAGTSRGLRDSRARAHGSFPVRNVFSPLFIPLARAAHTRRRPWRGAPLASARRDGLCPPRWRGGRVVEGARLESV